MLAPYAASRVLTAGYHQFHASDVVLAASRWSCWAAATTSSMDGAAASPLRRRPRRPGYSKRCASSRLIAPAVIISTGGQPDVTAISLPSAVTMRDELVRLGVPSGRIVVESASRSTHENALRVAPLVRSLGVEQIVLVTSAAHMRRAMGAFHAVGLSPIPAMTMPLGPPQEWDDWRPSSGTLGESHEIARELLGIPYYWLRGWWKG